MTNPRRNFFIVLFMLGLIAISGVIIATKQTRLGLDLKGGVELVYEGQPTPAVPKVTPQAIDDAISTIRKRTDALGVSEPEITRSSGNQITIGLPSVKNVDRAEQQVGSTAQLQFYDWEPNIYEGPNKLVDPNTASTAAAANNPIPNLFQAVKLASQSKPRAEATDVPAGGPNQQELQKAGIDPNNVQAVRQYYDNKNDTTGDKYYLFGPGVGLDRQLITGPDTSCQALLSDYTDKLVPGQQTTPQKVAKGSQCSADLTKLGTAGPPKGSIVMKVPKGVIVIKAERPPKLAKNVPYNQYFVVEDDSELSGSDIKNPKQTTDPQTGEPIVTMEFTDKGRKQFAAATKREAQRGAQQIPQPGAPVDNTFQRFAITLDNQIISLATINWRENPEGIDGRTGAQINGIGNIQETQDLAENLRIGALPINLKLISKTQVSSTLGKQALHQGLIAGAVGLALTLIFLISFYRVLGLVAALALVVYALLLFAIVKLIPITMTLPGIAGLILTLGVAADANIVIFERIKEEVRGGSSIPRAISNGYTKALRTIIDANVVTIGVAFILFMLATAGVKGFAFTLLVGTLVSLLTAVLLTSAVLGLLSRRRILRSHHALAAGKERMRWHFDFMGASKWFFSMSGVILVSGALAIAGLGINFGIDFKGGTRIITPVERKASVDQVRSTMSGLGYGDAKIQTVQDPSLGKNVIQITTKNLDPAKVRKVETALNKDFGVRGADFSASSVGPTFGSSIARTAIIAVIASLFLITLYIAMRFEFKFAVPVLIALAHDLFITAGVYALFQREVTTSTVAALLTILGYSLYDTIIVFDRIRENVPRMPRATFSQIVNRSMSEVLTRSLVTSLSTLIPITALMLFGGSTLRDFGFALLVGVASGTYSSIFIASPVLTHWKEREPVYRRRRQLQMEEHGGAVPAFATGTVGEPTEPVPAAGEPAPAAPVRGREARRAAAASRLRGDGAAQTEPQRAAPAALEEPPAAPEPEEAPEPDEAPEPVGEGPDGTDGGSESRVTSTSGPQRPKPQQQKKQRSRGKRRHGRR
ncbi:MAG: protein translocase subunit SecD [Thermoleophilaceae bacterium]